MLRRFIIGLTVSISTLACLPTAMADDYPQRNIEGIIQWGAGGATDNVARSLTPHVEKQLDASIILTNRPGGTGVIATNTVLHKRADGYTLLYGAENPQLYPILDLAKFDYGDFYPVNIIGQGLVVIAASPDKGWNTLQDLLDAAHENPGTLRMGSTGPGGLPDVLLSMINSVDKLDVRSVVFGGDGPGITALLGNHIDFMPLSLAGAQEQIKAGRLKALAVVSKDQIEALPEVAPITDTLPKMASYLPWGPFWGVFVRKETPDDIKQTLSKAYAQAVASEDFQKFLGNNGAVSLNLQGEDAKKFLDRWQSVTAWAMQDAGSTKVSPEKVGIPKP